MLPNERVVVFGSDYMLTDPDEFTPGVAVCADGTHDFDFHKWATDAFPSCIRCGC